MSKSIEYKSLSVITIITVSIIAICPPSAFAWMADNGNGTYTNPIFYDEFSDPDLIRVKDSYYLTGTTMHCMPGLPILRSNDLVNWEFLCYAFDKLDLGPEFRLENGREFYGQGIWAPCLRYNDGTWYIFTNVNRHGTQMFAAKNPEGPWKRTQMKRAFHDVSVLFDDDGKVYVLWGYQDLHLAELNDDLTDMVEGTEKIIIKRGSGMGEGVHFYKINGKYIITSAWFNGRMRMPCARADKPEGPYEINYAISMDEDFGLQEGYRLKGRAEYPFDVVDRNTFDGGRMSMHQGGIVSTPSGQWWGFSMMDYNSVGRLTCLSPVVWKDGWPYFGLEGNLKRTPRTWIKPETKKPSEPKKPYERSDDFNDAKLKPVWQWNHVPVDDKWSLTERKGYLRLHSLPSPDLWWARNSLTQRAVGPVSVPTAKLDTTGMKEGDVTGLALMNVPYAWVAVKCAADGMVIEHYNQLINSTTSVPFDGQDVWLRANCDYLTDMSTFSYSLDGKDFKQIGGEFKMVYQLKTFQGIRYTLFNYNTTGKEGGYADFDSLIVDEPFPNGLTKEIPYGQKIKISTYGDLSWIGVSDGRLKAVSDKTDAAEFAVVDMGLGRAALKTSGGFVTVSSADGTKVDIVSVEPGKKQSFQWVENVYGDLMLMSIVSNRHIRADKETGEVTADCAGPRPDRKDGSCLTWNK